MIKVIESVRFRALRPEIYSILPVLDAVFSFHGQDCVITSANDKLHKPGSLHYVDKAIDLRSHDLPSGSEQVIVNEIREAIGQDYDVIFEDQDTPNEHIHLEYDPKWT